ncbi:MAG: hypothetical protein R3D80_06540 [Paracoccaceae bacterium]
MADSKLLGEVKGFERQDHSKNANHASTAPAFFSAHDIHAYYGESHRAGRELQHPRRRILALLGRNGAGKTSTLRAIARTGNPAVTHGGSGSTASRCTG